MSYTLESLLAHLMTRDTCNNPCPKEASALMTRSFPFKHTNSLDNNIAIDTTSPQNPFACRSKLN